MAKLLWLYTTEIDGFITGPVAPSVVAWHLPRGYIHHGVTFTPRLYPSWRNIYPAAISVVAWHLPWLSQSMKISSMRCSELFSLVINCWKLSGGGEWWLGMGKWGCQLRSNTTKKRNTRDSCHVFRQSVYGAHFKIVYASIIGGRCTHYRSILGDRCSQSHAGCLYFPWNSLPPILDWKVLGAQDRLCNTREREIRRHDDPAGRRANWQMLVAVV